MGWGEGNNYVSPPKKGLHVVRLFKHLKELPTINPNEHVYYLTPVYQNGKKVAYIKEEKDLHDGTTFTDFKKEYKGDEWFPE